MSNIRITVESYKLDEKTNQIFMQLTDGTSKTHEVRDYHYYRDKTGTPPWCNSLADVVADLQSYPALACAELTFFLRALDNDPFGDHVQLAAADLPTPGEWFSHDTSGLIPGTTEYDAAMNYFSQQHAA